MLPDDKTQKRIVIVGGGVIGIACAHYLCRSGWKVEVIDKAGIGQACSYGNCGYICPSHVAPLTEPGAPAAAVKSLFNWKSPFRVKPSLNPSFLKWMWQFAGRCNRNQVLAAGTSLQSILNSSMREYQQLMVENSFDCEWNTGGLLYVFRSQAKMDSFAKNHDWLNEHFEVASRKLDGSQIRDLENGLRLGLAGGFHYPADATVRPDRLNSQWVKQLQRQGVRFVDNCELQAINKLDGVVSSLSTSRGEITADAYVFAMGAMSTRWSNSLECDIPIQPGKGYSLTIACSDAKPQHSMLFPEVKVGVTPFKDGMRLGSMMEFVGYDDSIPDYRIQQLRDAARKYLIASVDEPEQEKWYGWRPMTWDSLPVIGPAPKLKNAFLATGHNMLGLSMAPATGRLVSEIINGTPPHIPARPFSVQRFQGRRAVTKTKQQT